MKPSAAAVGITKPQSRSPNRCGSADASRKPDADTVGLSCHIKRKKKGRNENVSALFHVSVQAVTGRLVRLTVAPVPVIFSVTPPPE